MNKIKQLIKSFFLIELLKGFSVTFGSFVRSKVTLQYPEEETPLSVRARNMLGLRRFPNGEERCIACKLCEVTCPAAAITIEAGPREEDGSRRATKYEIDVFKCINCGFCEEACPVDAIVSMREMHYHLENRGEEIMVKEKLLAIGELYEVQIAKDRAEDEKYR